MTIKTKSKAMTAFNVSLLVASLAMAGCSEKTETKSAKPQTLELQDKQAQSVLNKEATIEERIKESALESVDDVLAQNHACNDSIVIRSQDLAQEQLEAACKTLVQTEDKFHQIFSTRGKPVADDNNQTMRANIYNHRDDFVKYATAHFTMPTDNGGMYLEGYPDRKGNQAEFVAYEREGQIWNLSHEFVHYLDGRFNKYGDYCNGLHDDHAGPEFCPTPHRAYPHIVWWAEGIAEYVAKGDDNPKALEAAKDNSFLLSELFNTSSNENTGGVRVYNYGYLAVRFMMENHRDDVETMLNFIRTGNWDGYQTLVKGWGTQFDKDFEAWLTQL